jgi:hypothetical protein
MESESEGVRWSRSQKEFRCSRTQKEFRWSRSGKEFLGGVGVGKICTDSDSDLSLKS